MNTNRTPMPFTSLRPLSLFLGVAIVGGAIALGGCQTPPAKSSLNAGAWRVDPVVRVSDSAERGNRSGESYYQLGRYYDGQRRNDRALDAYRKAVRSDPAHLEAHNALGVLLARQGRVDEAIQEFETAASLSSDRAHVLNNLGYAYMLAGRNDEAIRTLSQAARLDPSNLKARSNLAMAMHRGGMPQAIAVAQTEAEAGVTREEPATPVVAGATSAAGSSLTVTVFDTTSPSVQIVADMPHSPAITIVSGSSMEAIEVAPNVVEIRGAEIAATPTIAVGNASAPVVPPSAIASRTYRLEVANGMGVTGTAKRVGAMLREQGAPSARLTDQRPFQQAATVVQFAEGYQREAGQVAEWLGTRPMQIASPQLRLANVRVVIGRDILPVLAAHSTKSSEQPALRLVASN